MLKLKKLIKKLNKLDQDLPVIILSETGGVMYTIRGALDAHPFDQMPAHMAREWISNGDGYNDTMPEWLEDYDGDVLVIWG